MNTKQIINGSLVLGVALSVSSTANANAFSFHEVGEATSVRVALSSAANAGALDLACGGKGEAKSKDAKCGSKKSDAKCGSCADKKSKDSKCGAKCADKKAKEHKCGEGKCGGKEEVVPASSTTPAQQPK